MKSLSVSNYRQLGFVNLCRIVMFRAVQKTASWFMKLVERGRQYDEFIRMANYHQCTLTKKSGNLLIRSPAEVIGQAHSVFLRFHSTDFMVYTSAIFGGDYSGLRALTQGNDDSIQLIVDAGANIGSTAILLNTWFPSARIISIESDPQNYEALVNNIKLNEIDRIKIKHAALWGTDKRLRNSGLENEHWGRSVTELNDKDGDSSTVQAITVDQIIKETGCKQIDILKIDIEGGEASVFGESENGPDWLTRVRLLAIELHSPALSIRIVKQLENRDFLVFKSGETTYAANRSFLK